MAFGVPTRIPWAPRHDGVVIGLLAVLVLGALAPSAGVWEPWEATQVSVVDQMHTTGQWLEVKVPAKGDSTRAVAELPFGWWPMAASTALLGTHEFSVRLPGVLLGAAALLLLFSVARRFFGRGPAWYAVLACVSMPLWGYHTRFGLGQGVPMALTAISSLAFLRFGADPSASNRWRWAAWLSLAPSALAGGFIALITPLVTGAAARLTLRPNEGPRGLLGLVSSPIPVVITVTLIGLGWWRAAAHMGEDSSLNMLLFLTERLGDAPKGVDRPSFELFVHQIGIGLFPLGAILPFAFASLLWGSRETPDASPSVTAVSAGAAAWFGVAFLGPALGATYSHFAIFLGAPVVALVVAVYLDRVLRSPPEPLFACATVLVVALIDSNLKHETQLFAETLVGGAVDSFPAKLPYWGGARILNCLLLGVLLVYQGGLHRWGARFVKSVAYPRALRPRLDWGSALLTVWVPMVLMAKASFLAPLVNKPYWGRLVFPIRRLIIALVIWALCYLLIRALWNLRVQLLQGRTRGRLTRLSDWSVEFAERPGLAPTAMTAVLGLWCVFTCFPVALALTTNFSQKGIIAQYDEYAESEEPLYRYLLDGENNSFYARSLPTMSRAEFTKAAKEDARFFAIVPRKQLSSINNEFRRASKRTLPVLDNRGSRYLLVSNQLRAGEEDKNPITSALIDALPEAANKITINFEDKIELVGWQIEPKEPRAGSPADITLYWRALTDNPGTWKVFVHIDATGQRIHGDHDPVENLFPTRNWKKGDLVRDQHRINIKRTISAARFTFYAGLYRGSTRMKIKSGAKDKENRARLGYITVK